MNLPFKIDLSNKVAVVTGGGGILCSNFAKVIAECGAKVAILDLNGEAADKVANEINVAGGTAIGVSTNVLQKESLVEAKKVINEKLGKIDILINNAGVATQGSLENTSIDACDKIMAINVRAPYALIKCALPTLKKSDRASIINIASVVAHAGYPNQSAYAASKHALLGFTKSLAAEVYKDGVRVHIISPGGVYTDMVKVTRPDLSPDGMIMPEDIADIVEFFLKNRNNAVIDEVLVHRLGKEPFLV